MRRLPVLLGCTFLVFLIKIPFFVMCILPVLFPVVSFMFLIPIIMMEGHHWSDNISRAWSLVSGRRLEVLAIFIIMYIITMMISGTTGVLNLLVPQTTFNLLWLGMVQSIAHFLVFPLLPISAVMLYYNARIEKEGYDLEFLARDLIGGHTSDQQSENRFRDF